MTEVIDMQGRRRKLRPGEILADGERMIVRMCLGDGKMVEAISTPDGMKPLTTLDKNRPHGATDKAAAERSYGAALARKHEIANAWRASK
jgi:hypothetical protein